VDRGIFLRRAGAGRFARRASEDTGLMSRGEEPV
jgi:hypothetical protein